MVVKKNVDVIGRAERIDLIDLGLTRVPSKVDTGAESSAIWVSRVVKKKDGLHCTFFGPKSRYYTGEVVIRKNYSVTRVANSFGHKELRYKVKLRIKVRGKTIRATFTLSDRSRNTYPILLGRRLLTGKFVVDVTRGQPLKKLEQAKAHRLKKDMKRLAKQEKKS